MTQSIAIPHTSTDTPLGADIRGVAQLLEQPVKGRNRRSNPRESADPLRTLTVGQCSFPHQTPPRSSGEPLGGSQTLPVHHFQDVRTDRAVSRYLINHIEYPEMA